MPNSLYPDTRKVNYLANKLFIETNQIPGEPPETVIHFATLSSPLHVKTKKCKQIPQDRHLKCDMVAYVEIFGKMGRAREQSENKTFSLFCLSVITVLARKPFAKPEHCA